MSGKRQGRKGGLRVRERADGRPAGCTCAGRDWWPACCCAGGPLGAASGLQGAGRGAGGLGRLRAPQRGSFPLRTRSWTRAARAVRAREVGGGGRPARGSARGLRRRAPRDAGRALGARRERPCWLRHRGRGAAGGRAAGRGAGVTPRGAPWPPGAPWPGEGRGRGSRVCPDTRYHSSETRLRVGSLKMISCTRGLSVPGKPGTQTQETSSRDPGPPRSLPLGKSVSLNRGTGASGFRRNWQTSL
ncbi:translation initiation factor IF-2 isoform X1 [Manis pentadactyla]|uniref:translation initiation factor IF-2 isoform X1 n=1 Tax=Manis pentadactyla TaxID=143292 RepID=UPI00255C7749|nr:translation initiation factor IF-2 isoform X1 [Manis pentadactyla]